MVPLLALLALVADTAWVISPTELRSLPADSVVVLDARGARDYALGHVPGAVRINWLRYRDGWFRTGRLPTDLDRLAKDMANLGVDERRRVVVYGSANRGWGEEGRIVWMLRFLGVPRVAMLDGGWQAWRAIGGVTRTGGVRRTPGQLRARPVSALRANRSDIGQGLAIDRRVVLDVRSTAEWNGATPYWEKRSGRIPGAVHVEWTSLLDSAGRLLPAVTARATLARLGLRASTPVIVYCTGGVRSSFALVALKHYGFADVRNYDGSWWEWSGGGG